jgi:hypothetical protein
MSIVFGKTPKDFRFDMKKFSFLKYRIGAPESVIYLAGFCGNGGRCTAHTESF